MPSEEESVNAVSPLMELFSLECFEIEHSSAAAISFDAEGGCDFFEYFQARELPLKIHMAARVRKKRVVCRWRGKNNHITVIQGLDLLCVFIYKMPL